jgi:hypothetical protein
MSKLCRFFILVGVLVILLGSQAKSAEFGTGVYLLGYQSSLAGFLPPPGGYGRLDFYWYQGNAQILPLNGLIEANLRNRTFLGVANLSYVTPWKFLEANYAAGLLWVPIGNAFIKGQADSPES